MTARHEEKARAAATRVARESYGKLVAYLAAPARDVPGAEDALADAFKAAIVLVCFHRMTVDRHEQRPETGCDELVDLLG